MAIKIFGFTIDTAAIGRAVTRAVKAEANQFLDAEKPAIYAAIDRGADKVIDALGDQANAQSVKNFLRAEVAEAISKAGLPGKVRDLVVGALQEKIDGINLSAITGNSAGAVRTAAALVKTQIANIHIK